MSAVIKRPDSAEMRNAIFRLEEYLKEGPQAELTWVHRFAPGLYAREMVVPAGVMLTGAIHKTQHISIMLTGRMIVPDEDGGSKEIVAPIVEIAKPGIKRVGYAVEEVRWITFHPTDETDVVVIENMIATNDFEEVRHLLNGPEPKEPVTEVGVCRFGEYRDREVEYLVDQLDYESLGISNDLLECLKGIEVHKGDVEGLEIRPSKRHGLGLFATGHIASGAIIAPMIDAGRLMEYSRYCNHSQNPNGYPDHNGEGQCDLIALRDIDNEEITVDYRVNLRRLT